MRMHRDWQKARKREQHPPGAVCAWIWSQDTEDRMAHLPVGLGFREHRTNNAGIQGHPTVQGAGKFTIILCCYRDLQTSPASAPLVLLTLLSFYVCTQACCAPIRACVSQVCWNYISSGQRVKEVHRAMCVMTGLLLFLPLISPKVEAGCWDSLVAHLPKVVTSILLPTGLPRLPHAHTVKTWIWYWIIGQHQLGLRGHLKILPDATNARIAF